ncbi:WD domain-containing protein, G-beta repeat-containing protein [Lentzea albida]|uniref:WD domain-containing protein, G-beta repeat-containing protein n=1 Tax=Lentzea albida TaxID=65499 RepID=A0A1H9M2P5_9PSEU|nr:WD domain-containing protein, G-beta repeat-containing protein [Lentzea albida]
MGRIFLSYHGHDEGDAIALYLRDALLAAGFEDVHAYTAPGSGPDVSLPWKDSLRRELLGADALIAVTSPGSFSEWCIWESSVFRERKPHAPCIEFFSARSQHRAILNDLQAQRVDATSPASLAAARDTVLEVLERAGVSKAAPLSSPFPGLKAFDEHQASLFFGREDDIQRLAEPLLGRRSHGAMAVIGPSGAGKSSLVRAGLIPLLRREGWTIIGPVTPSQGVLPPIEGPGRRLVVLDQAEELLMTESSDLVQQLVDASRGEAWVVYTVRADFLDELMSREDFAPLLRDDFLVTPLTKAELPVVVNGPLRSFGWSVDDAALGLIQEDASRESLPLLAFALENLWRHVNPDGKRAPRPITRAEYVASGRVMDVLRFQADEALAMARDLVRDEDGSWPSVRDAEHRVLQALRRLVAVDETGKFTRCSVAASDLSAENRRLLDPFITNRVLTATRETVEVAHESLFLHWPRLREELERDHSWAWRGADGLDPDDAVRLLVNAPDPTGWRRSLLRATASTHLLRSFTGHSDGVCGVDWSPDDTALVTGSKDGTVRLWDAETGECEHVFTHGDERGEVRAVAWSPKGDVVASVSTDRTLRLWSARTRRQIQVIGLPAGPRSVRFDSDGQRVLVACDDGGAYLWRAESDTPVPVDEPRRPAGTASGERVAGHREPGAPPGTSVEDGTRRSSDAGPRDHDQGVPDQSPEPDQSSSADVGHAEPLVDRRLEMPRQVTGAVDGVHDLQRYSTADSLEDALCSLHGSERFTPSAWLRRTREIEERRANEIGSLSWPAGVRYDDHHRLLADQLIPCCASASSSTGSRRPTGAVEICANRSPAATAAPSATGSSPTYRHSDGATSSRVQAASKARGEGLEKPIS